jgi:hypothetical protein
MPTIQFHNHHIHGTTFLPNTRNTNKDNHMPRNHETHTTSIEVTEEPQRNSPAEELHTTTIYLWLYSPCGPWPLLQFLNLYIDVRTPWMGDQPVARLLPTHRTTQTQNKRTQTSMTRIGFEPTIPVFERAKMVHALDFASTVIGTNNHHTQVKTLENLLRTLKFLFNFNDLLWRIFGPKGDEVTGGWRKLHNEELHNMYM